MRQIKLDKLVVVMKIFLTLLGLFIIYQILRKVFGGSWSAEDLILSALFFITASVITLGMLTVEMRSDMKHMKADLRRYNSDLRSMKQDFVGMKDSLKNIEFKIVSIKEGIQ